MFKRKGGGGPKAFWTMLKKLHFSYGTASLSRVRLRQKRWVYRWGIKNQILGSILGPKRTWTASQRPTCNAVNTFHPVTKVSMVKGWIWHSRKIAFLKSLLAFGCVFLASQKKWTTLPKLGEGAEGGERGNLAMLERKHFFFSGTLP